jgi:excisionase family DNA binding protein
MGRPAPARTPTEVQGASYGAVGLSAGQLLTPEQLAERLQIPKAHVYRLTRRGAIPCVRLGKYYRYHIDEIEAWERNGGTSHA